MDLQALVKLPKFSHSKMIPAKKALQNPSNKHPMTGIKI